jgi:hypothetical protein
MSEPKASPVTQEHWAIIERMVNTLREHGLRISSVEIELDSTRRIGGGVHPRTEQFTAI